MSDISPRDLNRHLVYLNRKRQQYMAGHLDGCDLVGPMYSILLCLERNPGINQDFLTSHFCIDKGTVARLSKRLEELGYIARPTCPKDRRVYRLVLTAKGQEVLLTIHDKLNQWSDAMLAGFSDEDRQMADALLQRMVKNIAD